MRFEWDEAKNRANVRKHGLHFREAAEMFSSILLTRPDTSDDYGEERWAGLGITRGRFAVVIFAVPEPGIIRIISLRKANHEERKHYETALRDGLGTD